MNSFMNVVNWLTRTLGRFLYAIPFLIFGVMHFMYGGNMAEMVPIPGGVVWVYITGAALVLAAVSIVIGKEDKLASFLLGLMLIIFALSVQLPGMMDAQAALQAAEEGSDAAMSAQQNVSNYMSQVLKDIALGGAAWMYAGSVGAKDKNPLKPG